MQEHKTGPNFLFIEQLLPSHVHVYEKNSLGIEGEKQAYLNRLEEANTWLKNNYRRDPKGRSGCAYYYDIRSRRFCGYGLYFRKRYKNAGQEYDLFRF